MTVTVLPVDDVPELRRVLRQCLRLGGRFEVVADVGDGASAVMAASHGRADRVAVARVRAGSGRGARPTHRDRSGPDSGWG